MIRCFCFMNSHLFLFECGLSTIYFKPDKIILQNCSKSMSNSKYVLAVFQISKSNIPNHHPELEIWISCLLLLAGISNFKFKLFSDLEYFSFFLKIWQTHCTFWNEATFRSSITVLQILSLTLVVHSMLDKDTVGCFGQLYRTKRINMKVVNLTLCIPATFSLSCFLLCIWKWGWVLNVSIC